MEQVLLSTIAFWEGDMDWESQVEVGVKFHNVGNSSVFQKGCAFLSASVFCLLCYENFDVSSFILLFQCSF